MNISKRIAGLGLALGLVAGASYAAAPAFAAAGPNGTHYYETTNGTHYYAAGSNGTHYYETTNTQWWNSAKVMDPNGTHYVG
jgi:hypothetical protein